MITMEKTELSPFLRKINSSVHERPKNKRFPNVGQNFLPITGGKRFVSKRKTLGKIRKKYCLSIPQLF